MLLLGIALSVTSSGVGAVVDSPCGVPDARHLLAFAVYSDKSTHRVNVERDLDIEIFRDAEGPIVIRDATSGTVLHSMPRSEFDGDVRLADGKLPESDGSVVKIAAHHGTLIIDPSSTLSRDGAWVFVCWEAYNRPSESDHFGHHKEVYSGIETSDAGDTVIRRTDGSTVPIPQFRHQVEIEGSGVSSDGKRVGWLVDLPNCCTSYPIPKRLVIFKAGKIERIFEEGQCIFGWTFEKNGTEVAYWISALHGTQYKAFFLRDVRTGKQLATYDYPDAFIDSEGPEADARANAVRSAPDWVRTVPGSD